MATAAEGNGGAPVAISTVSRPVAQMSALRPYPPRSSAARDEDDTSAESVAIISGAM